MRTAVRLAIALLIATPLIGIAQEQPKLSCTMHVTYNKEFLAKFPNAPAACNEVSEVNGEKWARFDAEVKKVQGNHLTLSFIDHNENPVATMTLAFTPEATVTLENKQVKSASAVEEGDKIVVWVPESRMGIYAKPGPVTSKHFALVSDRG